MQLAIIKSSILTVFLIVTSPMIISIISSVVFIIYILSMLKVNVIDLKHKGLWSIYFKSWINYFKTKK